MPRKITSPQLADLLGGASDVESTLATGFVNAFFSEIALTLQAGRSVKIDGLGEFFPDGTFKADRELADKLNSPFSAFEPVEMPENITEDMLRPTVESEISTVVSEKMPEPVKLSEVSEAPEAPTKDSVAEAVAASASVIPDSTNSDWRPEEETVSADEVRVSDLSAVSESETEEPVADNSAESTVEIQEQAVYTDIEYPVQYEQDHSRATLWIMTLVGFAIGLAAGALLAMWFYSRPIEEPVEEPEIETKEIVTEEPIPDPSPSDATSSTSSTTLTTDTVRPGYYLTTMSRRHYGSKDFWVYIYEENASRQSFSHPERIPPGTLVNIPAAEKYGIDPNNPESVKAARQKAHEIYSRYQ